MKKYFFVLVTFLTLEVKSQLNFTASSNVSLISISQPENNVIEYKTFKNYYLPGFNAGIHFDKLITGKFSMNLGVQYSLLRSKNYIEIDFSLSNGVKNIGYVSTVRKLQYIQMPIMISWNVKEKLKIQLGGQLMYLLSEQEIEKGGSIIEGKKTVDFSNNYTNRFDLKKVDFGTLSNISYTLLPKISIQVTYYYGLTNIFNDNSIPDWKWQNSQFCLGVKYYLSKK